ncbi:MAG: Fur family transcriptional regulator [Anaerolineales bacterium]
MKDSPNDRFEDLITKFREQGYRMTPQRMEILRLLAASNTHPSALQLHERIKEKFPTTSLSTVYKTLDVLKEMGEVVVLGFSGDDTHYDAAGSTEHPHLICLKCRKIIDVETSSLQDLFQEIQTEVTEHSDYQIISHRVDFFGICPECQKGMGDKIDNGS